MNKAIVSTDTGNTYEINNIKTITYVKGKIIITFFDANDDVATDIYSVESLKNGQICIM